MGSVTRRALVRRPIAEVAKLATDADVVLPIIGGFGKFEFITENPDGSAEWDVYLDVGTIHIGGRVLVEPPTGSTLAWHSLRGTRHYAHIDVDPVDGGTVVTMTITAEFGSFIAGWLTGMLADGILGRHIEAGLQQLRHQIEYGTDATRPRLAAPKPAATD